MHWKTTKCFQMTYLKHVSTLNQPTKNLSSYKNCSCLRKAAAIKWLLSAQHWNLPEDLLLILGDDTYTNGLLLVRNFLVRISQSFQKIIWNCLNFWTSVISLKIVWRYVALSMSIKKTSNIIILRYGRLLNEHRLPLSDEPA